MPQDLHNDSIRHANRHLRICAYTSVEPSVVALAEVLFGQTPPVARLPVELPGLLPRGHAG